MFYIILSSRDTVMNKPDTFPACLLEKTVAVKDKCLEKGAMKLCNERSKAGLRVMASPEVTCKIV